jgi:hypothetical protein
MSRHRKIRSAIRRLRGLLRSGTTDHPNVSKITVVICGYRLAESRFQLLETSLLAWSLSIAVETSEMIAHPRMNKARGVGER